MRAGLTLIAKPDVEPVGVPQVKAFLRIEQVESADDVLIEEIARGAREYIEEQCSFAFITQTWDQTMDQFPYMNEPIELLRGPVSSIASVKYTDSSGQQITWAPSNYLWNGSTRPPRIAPAYGQWWPLLPLQPLANVTVRFVAGVAKPEDAPQRYKHALYMLIGHWYENRSDVEVGTIASRVPEGSADILAGLRPPLFA